MIGDVPLATPASEQVRQRLHVALADLRNLAGLARAGGLTANVCYRLGRVFLHHGQLDEVSRYFDLGQEQFGAASVRDRFRPLAAHARKLRGHAGALALAERIDAGTATPGPARGIWRCSPTNNARGMLCATEGGVGER